MICGALSMTCCLNPDCQQPQNPDDAEYCLSCGFRLASLLRNRYRVVRLIGQGGFGRTYLATDEDRLQARCVVKQFSPQLQGTKSLEKAILLFEQEAMRLFELGEHPQIPTLLAYFEQDQRLYLVQQFIEGQTLLQELSQQGVFSEQKIRETLAGVLPLLKFIHDRQVIHRDITPANIIRRKLDNKLVLIDFGVSKLLSAETSGQPGTKIGTEGYAPIEQLRSGQAYPASDLYSLAVTCLYLMTQVRPDELYDPMEGRWLWREHLKKQGRGFSEGIAHILDRMVKDMVSERYQSAEEVMRDLKGVLTQSPLSGGSTAATTNNPGISTSRPISSRPLSSPPSRQPISRGQVSGQPSSGTPRSGTPVSGNASSPHVSSPPPPSSPPSSPPLRSGSGRSTGQPIISGIRGRHCLRTLVGHSQWVFAVAISPDGQTVVSGGLDNTIQVWDCNTGEPLRVLKGHSNAINCLAITPDSQILVSGSDDDTIKTWHLPTGMLLLNLMGHTRDVNSVEIYGNGHFLASGSEDRTVRIWNLDTGEALQTFTGLAGMVKAVAVSPDETLLASGGLDNQIKLWSLKTGGLVRTFGKGHFNSVNSVVIHPNGKTLVSGSKDKTIKVWDVKTGEPIRTLTGHTDAVNAIALSPSGKLLVSGSNDMSIKLWNLDTGDLVATLNEHVGAVNAVAISRDAQFIASGSSDKTVKIWQIT